ncbi:MAG: hypothetical protein ACK4HM_03295, partial [Thermosynechococcus sp.]
MGIPVALAKDLTLSAGNININSSINVGAKHLRLWSNGGSVTQAITANIIGDGLVLVGSSTFDLNNAAGNNFNTIATGTATGPIAYRDTDTLTVGSVTLNTLDTWPNCCSSNATPITYSGITTNNNDVIIQTGGTLTLANASNLGGGNLTLISGNGVTQNSGANITAGGLGLQGSGTFDLNNASNNVDTFAANVTGGVSFSDTNGFTLGSVTSNTSTDTATTSGLTTGNNDAILNSGSGTLTLANSSDLGTGNLTLISGNGVTQNSGASITAGGLG